MCNIYKPSSDLYIADLLSRQNHTENEDEEIEGIHTNSDSIKNTTNIPTCTTTKDT